MTLVVAQCDHTKSVGRTVELLSQDHLSIDPVLFLTENKICVVVFLKVGDLKQVRRHLNGDRLTTDHHALSLTAQ